jgi:hypothetical protein
MMMRKLLLGCFALVALQAPALAAPGPSCDAVAGEWHAAAFASPAKPSQFRVVGQAGHETSGPEYRTIAEAIRQACGSADPVVARQEAALADTLLQRGRNGL